MTDKRRIKPTDTADDGQSCARLSRVRVWFIDCDDTLYESSRGMFAAIHLRMEQFIAQRLSLSIEEAKGLQHAYWARYGATFLGLYRHHGIEPTEFFDATHRFDLSASMPEDYSRAKLRTALKALKGRRVLVTNGPSCYVKALLPILGVEDLFDSVVSADDMRVAGSWRCKPDALLFARLAAQFNARPEQCAFVEDSPSNLKTAKRLGMLTVWCSAYRKAAPHQPHSHAWADIAVGNLFELARWVRLGRETARRTRSLQKRTKQL